MKTTLTRPKAFSILLFIGLSLGFNSTGNATVYFVRSSGNDANPGISWAFSFKTLRHALAIAGPGDVINVSQGTYTPSSTLNATASFNIPSLVTVYGGYPAVGNPGFAARDPKKYPTILSGDLDGDNDGDSYTVVKFLNVMSGTLVDGFVIQFGMSPIDSVAGGITNRADAGTTSNPTVKNCTFRYNTGLRISAVSNLGGGKVNYSYCNFSDNKGFSTFFNGSIDQNVRIEHSLFSDSCKHEIYNVVRNATENDTLRATVKILYLNNCGFVARLPDCEIIQNEPAYGIIADSSFLIAEKSVFIGGSSGVNTDNFNGFHGITTYPLIHTSLSGCTFQDQTSFSIRLNESLSSSTFPSYLSIKNCVLGTQVIATGTEPFRLNISFSNFGFPLTSSDAFEFSSGSGNLNVAPKFLNPASPLGADGIFGTADDGYNLVDCSPGINQGDNIADTTTADAAGLPRAFNSQRDMGAYEFQSVPQVSQLANSNETATRYVYAGNNILLDDNGNCGLIASIQPSGASMINGKVVATMHVEPSVQIHSGIPYMPRHVDIEPATNAANATATITLYCTQADFDAFNVGRGTFPHLPMNSGDMAGRANLRITQYHGTSTLFTPGSYSGSSTLIDPTNSNIIWNTTYNRWEITFTVTGFSGFFIHTGLVALPLHLGSFTGVHHSGDNILSWMTLSEMNTASFMVKRSTDGIKFVTIATIPAAGNSSLPRNYTFTDNHFTSALNYYRLQMIDINGSYTFSSVIALRGQSSSTISVSPNPFSNIINVEIPSQTGGHATLALLDGNGRSVLSKKLVLQSGTNVVAITVPAGTAPGLYVLRIEENNRVSFLKLIKN